jgi:drug/metabolite transporter (DMT)-like permease
MVLVGSSVISGKLLTNSMPVFLVSGIRMFFPLIIFYVLLKLKNEKIPKLSKKEKIILFVQALAGNFIFNTLLFYGLRYTSGIDAGILLSFSPAFAAVIAYFFLKEKLATKKMIGIALAIAGIIFLNLMNGDISAQNRFLGNIMILCVALSEGIFVILGKHNAEKLSAYQLSYLITLISFMLFLPFSIYEGMHFNFSGISTDTFYALIYYIIFVGVLPYLLVYSSIKDLKGSQAGVLTTLIPISGIVLSAIFLGEHITVPFFLGSIITLVGIVITME